MSQSNISLETLAQYFHLPITEVARKLGVRSPALSVIISGDFRPFKFSKGSMWNFGESSGRLLHRMLRSMKRLVGSSPACKLNFDPREIYFRTENAH